MVDRNQIVSKISIGFAVLTQQLRLVLLILAKKAERATDARYPEIEKWQSLLLLDLRTSANGGQIRLMGRPDRTQIEPGSVYSGCSVA